VCREFRAVSGLSIIYKFKSEVFEYPPEFVDKARLGVSKAIRPPLHAPGMAPGRRLPPPSTGGLLLWTRELARTRRQVFPPGSATPSTGCSRAFYNYFRIRVFCPFKSYVYHVIKFTCCSTFINNSQSLGQRKASYYYQWMYSLISILYSFICTIMIISHSI
jgi:hypothetical protein